MNFYKSILNIFKKINLNMVLFMLPLFLMGLLNVTYINKNHISSAENRGLKSMPVFSLNSLFSGTFIKDYEDYYSDNFIYREKLIGFSNEIKKLRGISTGNDVALVSVAIKKEDAGDKNINPVISSDSNIKSKDKNSASNQSTANTSVASSSDNNPSDVDSSNVVNSNYIILGTSAIEIHNYNEALYTQYAQGVNKLKQNLGNNVNVYSMIVPTAFEFIKNSNYKKLGDPEITGISKVNDLLIPNINKVDAYNALKNNSDKYLYFRTDQHWTALGAYYAYTAFMNSKGETAIPLENYTQGKIEGYLGTLYGATQSKKLIETPDTIYYYKPIVSYKFYDSSKNKREILDFQAANVYDKYCLFLGGLRVRGEITTTNNNGKKLLIIKDSFGNALTPFLIPHYQNIYIIDPRACDVNIKNFVQSNGIQDVLVMNNVFSITKYDFPNLISKLSN